MWSISLFTNAETKRLDTFHVYMSFFIVTCFMTLHYHQFINKMIESGIYNHTNVFRAVEIS